MQNEVPKSPPTALPSSDNHAGNGEGKERHSDEGEPRGSVPRTGKVVAEEEQHQQAKLHLPDPDNNSKHAPHPFPIPADAETCKEFLPKWSHVMKPEFKQFADMRKSQKDFREWP